MLVVRTVCGYLCCVAGSSMVEETTMDTPDIFTKIVTEHSTSLSAYLIDVSRLAQEFQECVPSS